MDVRIAALLNPAWLSASARMYDARMHDGRVVESVEAVSQIEARTAPRYCICAVACARDSGYVCQLSRVAFSAQFNMESNLRNALKEYAESLADIEALLEDDPENKEAIQVSAPALHSCILGQLAIYVSTEIKQS